MSTRTQGIYNHIRNNPRSTPDEVAKTFGLCHAYAYQIMKKMVKKGQLVRVSGRSRNNRIQHLYSIRTLQPLQREPAKVAEPAQAVSSITKVSDDGVLLTFRKHQFTVAEAKTLRKELNALFQD